MSGSAVVGSAAKGGVAVAEIFVSHAGRDRAWAEWVAWQLEQAGLSVELDYWDWKAGQNFVAQMSAVLGSCKAMVALFSEAYFEPTRWTGEEWTAALVLAKDDPGRFVPVRIDDAPVQAARELDEDTEARGGLS